MIHQTLRTTLAYESSQVLPRVEKRTISAIYF